MFTCCTECQTLQTLTTEQLRNGQGMLRCEKCGTLFNALEFISETKDLETALPKSLLWNQDKPTGKTYWRAGSLLGLALVFGQLIYFEGPALIQHPTLRPWLEKLCTSLACQLPTYKNLQELVLLQGALELQADQSIVFSAVITNQAESVQAYPNLKLTLLDYAGLPFSQRIFQPYAYLPEASQAPHLIMPDAASEITLSLAAPKTKIGGYTFELTD